MSERLPNIDDLVFQAFNEQVIAMDRFTGEVSWEWKCTHVGYPALLLDGDRLIVSFNGYTYCLDPLTGAEVWNNELKGRGTGVPVLASVRGGSTNAQTQSLHQTNMNAQRSGTGNAT